MSDKKFIAGWLLIPAGITWLAPLILGSAVYQGVHQVEGDLANGVGLNLLFANGLSLVWLALLFCGSLGLVYLLVRHSRLYPKLSTVLALSLVGSLLVVASINAVIFKYFLDRDDCLIMLGLLVASISWWVYMRHSHRVRATFSAAHGAG